MNRRNFLKSTAAISVLQLGCSNVYANFGERAPTAGPIRRVRPGEPGWPSAASWEKLNQEVGGRLIEVKPPLADCRAAPKSAECTELFKKLKNPFYIGDEPGLTQTS